MESVLAKKINYDLHKTQEEEKEKNVIIGDQEHILYIKENVTIKDSKMIRIDEFKKGFCVESEVFLEKFPAGSCVVLQVSLGHESEENVKLLKFIITLFYFI